MRIFLSYDSRDRDRAEEIALALEGRGHDVFFDRADLEPGADYHAVIHDRVASADLFIFLITPESVRPGAFALSELKLARERWSHPREHVLPVMLDRTELPLIPPYLRGVTLFEPEGNVATEVAAHVAKRRRRRRRRAFAAAAVVVVAAAAAGGYLLAPSESAAQWPVAGSDFVSHVVYPPDVVERIEYTMDPTSRFPSATVDLVRVERVAFGSIADTALAVSVTVLVANGTSQTVALDLTHRFFAMEDDRGTAAELVYFCCADGSRFLNAGEERRIEMIFRADPSWTGKETLPGRIYFRVNGLLPVVSGSWAFPPLATAA